MTIQSLPCPACLHLSVSLILIALDTAEFYAGGMIKKHTIKKRRQFTGGEYSAVRFVARGVLTVSVRQIPLEP